MKCFILAALFVLPACATPAEAFTPHYQDARCSTHYPISHVPFFYRCELVPGEVCYANKEGGLSCFYKPPVVAK